MALTDLSGTTWRADCLTIGQYDEFPDPTDDESPPFVNVIGEEEPDVPTPGSQPVLYVLWNDPEYGFDYWLYDETPLYDESYGVNPPDYSIYTYVVDESNGTILLTFNDNLTLGSDYYEGNITWLENYAEQIIDSPVLPSFSDVEVTPHEGYITMTINGVDFNLKTAASVSLISFRVTIRGETPSFNAEEGMTWAEWVASEYNTDGFSISGSNVVYIDLVVTYDGSAVSPSDVIIAHTIYYTATGD